MNNKDTDRMTTLFIHILKSQVLMMMAIASLIPGEIGQTLVHESNLLMHEIEEAVKALKGTESFMQ